jgi:hypothetical protein
MHYLSRFLSGRIIQKWRIFHSIPMFDYQYLNRENDDLTSQKVSERNTLGYNDRDKPKVFAFEKHEMENRQ